MSTGIDRHSSLTPGSGLGFDDDLDVLVERVEESEQSVGRELSQSAAQDLGHFGLVDLQNGRDFGLSQPFGFNHLRQSLSQPRLQQSFRGLCVSQVGEHIAAARFSGGCCFQDVSPDAASLSLNVRQAVSSLNERRSVMSA